VLWFLELQIRRGRRVETQVHAVSTNSPTSICQCGLFTKKNLIIRFSAYPDGSQSQLVRISGVLLYFFCIYSLLPNLELATRLISLFTLVLSRSLGFKHLRLKVLHLVPASVGQVACKIHTIFFCVSKVSAVLPSFNIRAVGLCELLAAPQPPSS